VKGKLTVTSLARSRRRIAGGACRLACLLLAVTVVLCGGAALAEPKHAIAMHGEPALPPDFDHFPAANPDAPKGGSIAFAGQGTFDSLNPFIVKGAVPDGLWARSAFWGDNVWESLLVRNWDEPFTLYGHLAEFVEVPDDRSWVEFTMNPDARFSDGEPVTAEDVVFSFNLLKEKGRPAGWHDRIDHVETKPGGKVRFVFGDGADRELPLIVGLMHVFPKHATDPEAFGETTLDPVIGSGPYVIAGVDAGKTVTLKKNPDYWGKDLPSRRGYNNFDEIRIEYFRDANTLFEAFKKGLFDVTLETDTTRWSQGYNFPAVKDGRVMVESVETGTPAGMNGFVFNQRNPIFQDARVREALTYFFDFEWINRSLYESKYKRTGSYFQGSVLSALGRPASARERELLAPFPDAVREDIMEGTYAPPVSDGSGHDRNNLRKGIDLLTEAGYERRGNVLVNKETGKPLTFEILVRDTAEERLALSYQQALRIVGIDMSVRQVDSAQYWERILNTREFDVIHWVYSASLSPGNEQIGRWSKLDDETFGRLNFAGVSSPAIDAMIDALLAARSEEEFIDAVRAYDRVLMSGFYVVPLFHSPDQWVAHWARVEHPENASLYGVIPMTWWAAK
jgi:peptide/nickel transport system substrate-binding protein